MAPTGTTARPHAPVLLPAVPRALVAVVVVLSALLGVPLLAADPARADETVLPAPAAVVQAPWTVAPEGTYRTTSRTIAYADPTDTQRQMDVVVPTGAAPGRPIVVLIHGGGYYRGDKSSWTGLARKLASSGYVAVNMNYRLSTRPDGAWPAQRDDLDRALTWARSHAGWWQADPTRIGVMGASAGGHLALFAGGRKGVRAIAVWSPMLDPYDVAYVSRAGSHLAQNLIQRTARCTYLRCPATWTRSLRPIGFGDTRATVPIFAANSTDELIDERPLLGYAGRVRARGGVFDVALVPGSAHAVGAVYGSRAWPATLAHFGRHL